MGSWHFRTFRFRLCGIFRIYNFCFEMGGSCWMADTDSLSPQELRTPKFRNLNGIEHKIIGFFGLTKQLLHEVLTLPKNPRGGMKICVVRTARKTLSCAVVCGIHERIANHRTAGFASTGWSTQQIPQLQITPYSFPLFTKPNQRSCKEKLCATVI